MWKYILAVDDPLAYIKKKKNNNDNSKIKAKTIVYDKVSGTVG